MKLLTLIHTKTYLLFIFLVSTGLIVSNIVVSASLSTSGQKLKELELRQDQLSEENQDLKQQILRQASLTNLEEKSTALGFVEPTHITSLNHTSQVALSPQQ